MVKKLVIGKSSISVLEKYISGLFVHVLSKLIRVVCKLLFNICDIVGT